MKPTSASADARGTEDEDAGWRRGRRTWNRPWNKQGAAGPAGARRRGPDLIRVVCRFLTLPVAAGLALTVAGTALASTPPAHNAFANRAALGPGLRAAPSSIASPNAEVCAKVAAKAGFSYTHTVDGLPQMVVAVSVAMAESSCNFTAEFVNSNGCVDRGLWQIDNCAHPNVSNACAFQVQCNADAAFSISSDGTDWGPWSTFQSGVWRNYISTAEAAVTGFSFQLESQGDGTCLDADSAQAHDAGLIFQFACNGSDRFQQWEVVDVRFDNVILKNVGTGTCLDADGGKVGDADPIWQWSCNSSDHFQQWWFGGSSALSSNAQAEVHNVGAGNCLDADGGAKGDGQPIFQWRCNGKDRFQLWD
jgi:Lysozyme like domain/Ricin-type beta-trefoil lectin domain